MRVRTAPLNAWRVSGVKTEEEEEKKEAAVSVKGVESREGRTTKKHHKKQ